jgi:hypothetical protein
MAAVLLECGHAVSELIDVAGEPRCQLCEDDAIIDSEVEEAEEERLDGDGALSKAQVVARAGNNGGAAAEAEPGGPQGEEPRAGGGASDESARQDTEAESVNEGAEGADSTPQQPVHSVRADQPGPRGCWALAKHGGPCHAAALRGGEFCAGHAGIGVAANPAHYAPLGQRAHREQLAVRATMRAMYGGTRPNSPRAVLRAHVHREAARLASTAVSAALDPSVDPLRAGSLAIKLIETADPPAQASLELTTDLTPEQVDRLSYSELLRVAEAWNLDTSDPSEAPAAGLPGPATTPPEPRNQAV